jgi:hypothetical protein
LTHGCEWLSTGHAQTNARRQQDDDSHESLPALIGECMSSEPLPLPEIWSDPPAGEGETARTELFANSRSSLVLIEYASGYAQQPDLQAFIRPVAPPRQPAARERLPSLAPAALLRGLADLGSIVTQAEALLRAQGTLKSDAHFAVEHIHDVAMALRMRDVEAALCDTLDASVREVGDALVRHEAAATGAFSAAALLRDVMRRLEDLTVVAARISAADLEAPSRPPISEAHTGIKPSPAVVSESVVGESVVIEPVVSEEPRDADDGLGATFSTGPKEEGAQHSQEHATEMPSAGTVDVFAADDERVHASLPAASDTNDIIAADLLAADAAAVEGVSADAFATAIGAVDPVTVDTVEPDIFATDAVAADTVTADADATATDTVATEIVVSDRVVSDTVVVDEGAAGTVAAETTATDSLAAEIVGSDAVAADTVVAHAIATDPAPSGVSADPLVVSGSVPQSQAAATPEDEVAAVPETTAPNLPFEESFLMPHGREAEPAVPVAGGDDIVAVARDEGGTAPIGKTDATFAVPRATPTNDPLAVLYGLSEEELIALFS